MPSFCHISSRIWRKPDTKCTHFWDLFLCSALCLGIRNLQLRFRLAFRPSVPRFVFTDHLLQSGSLGPCCRGNLCPFLCFHSVIPHPRRPSASQGQSRPHTTQPSVVVLACNHLSSEFRFLSMWPKNHLLQNQLGTCSKWDSGPLPGLSNSLGLSPRNLFLKLLYAG